MDLFVSRELGLVLVNSDCSLCCITITFTALSALRKLRLKGSRNFQKYIRSKVKKKQ